MQHRESQDEHATRSVRLRATTWRKLSHLRIDRGHGTLDDTVAELLSNAADTIRETAKEDSDV